MNNSAQTDNHFVSIYNRSYRLASAVFAVSSLMDNSEEIKAKLKSLALGLVSISVKLKDAMSAEGSRLISEVEKNCLELMSLIDIAAVAGLISKMNGEIIKNEFESFISELKKFSWQFENNNSGAVKGLLSQDNLIAPKEVFELPTQNPEPTEMTAAKSTNIKSVVGLKIVSTPKRKDVRRDTILEFIKGHTQVSIKDIVPNIKGCSEKTVQRELMELIKEGKIRKEGERRWSRYSAIID